MPRGRMLSALRVLEIEGSLAGGYAAKLLADHGAAVTKVVGQGPPSLGWTPAVRVHLDRAKATAAPTDAGGMAELVAAADVVIESSSPNPLRSVLGGLPHDRARIGVEISPLGSVGPLGQRCSTDLTDQAISGHLFLNGDPDREPLRAPDHQVAYAAGAHAAIGALAAVLARHRSGRGQRVEVTHQQVMTALHQFTLLRYTHNGDILTRMGNRYAGPGNPVGVYRCRTGLIALIVPRSDQLESLLAVTGLEHLLDHPEVDGTYGLMHHPTLIDQHLGPWLAANELDETIDVFQALRIPAGAVSTMADVLADEHLAARGSWLVTDVGGRRVRTPGPAATITRWPDDQPTRRPGRSTAVGDGDLAAGPLTGVRVLDLTRVWAGPYSTRVLADLGADVIMIEAPWARGGATIDDASVAATRFYPDNEPGERHWNRIGFANKFNINKRNLAIDLGTEAGIAVLETLIADADVLVENYSPRVMPNFGLDEARLRRLNPSLVYVTMPGFGRSGPLHQHVAYGPIIDSQAGFSVLMGYPGEGARKAGVAWPDPVSGMHAAFATLVAVLERELDGAGRVVEVAQIEAAVAMIGHALAEAQLSGTDTGPIGNRDRRLAPQGVYRCAGHDRWIAVSVVDDIGWVRLCDLGGFEPGWRAWPVEERRRRHDAIDRAIAGWTSGADQEGLVAALQWDGIAAAPVADAAQVMVDPQLAAQDFFVELDHPEAGRHRWPKLAIGLSETPATYRRPGAMLNQHGVEILTDLAGLTPPQIAELFTEGVVSDCPPD